MKNVILAALLALPTLAAGTAAAQEVRMPALQVRAPKPVHCVVRELEQGSGTVRACG